MKDEIKEILECLKEEDNYWSKQKHEYAWPDYYSLNREDLHILLDYITNLQTIEQQYSALLSENVELENRIKELETINEEHRKLNGELRKTINEAIEYMYDPDNFLCINVEEQGRVLMDEDAQNDLLNILQGKGDE